MAATYMLRKHLATVESAGKPEAIAERAIDQKAREQAAADRRRRYPVITSENFEAADQFQKERIAYWKSRFAA